jgi:hypothetical protein
VESLAKVVRVNHNVQVKRVTSTQARKEFADIIERAFHYREVTVVRHYDRDFVAIVPADSVDIAEIESGARKGQHSAGPAKKIQKRSSSDRQET